MLNIPSSFQTWFNSHSCKPFFPNNSTQHWNFMYIVFVFICRSIIHMTPHISKPYVQLPFILCIQISHAKNMICYEPFLRFLQFQNQHTNTHTLYGCRLDRYHDPRQHIHSKTTHSQSLLLSLSLYWPEQPHPSPKHTMPMFTSLFRGSNSVHTSSQINPLFFFP